MRTDHECDPGFDASKDEVMESQYHHVLSRPRGDPDKVINGYEVFMDWETEGAVPECVYVYEEPEDEAVATRLWTFVSVDWGLMLFSYHRHHEYHPTSVPGQPDHDNPRECCFKIQRHHGLSMRHVPDAVIGIVEHVADAPVVGPSPSSLPPDPADSVAEPKR